MKPETYLRRRICDMIRREFPDAWVYHPAFMLRAGLPDLFICYRGRFIGLEVKTPIGTINPLQRYTLDEIKRCGGVGEFVRSVDEVRNVLKEIKTLDNKK